MFQKRDLIPLKVSRQTLYQKLCTIHSSRLLRTLIPLWLWFGNVYYVDCCSLVVSSFMATFSIIEVRTKAVVIMNSGLDASLLRASHPIHSWDLSAYYRCRLKRLRVLHRLYDDSPCVCQYLLCSRRIPEPLLLSALSYRHSRSRTVENPILCWNSTVTKTKTG